jgi:hypothetical protein
MSNDFINLIKGRAWSPVPDDILEDTRMSLKARAVMAWIVGRPSNWILYIRQMQRKLGMTETMWKSVRCELETAGYYKQERVRRSDGKIYWEKSITDASVPSPQSPPMAKTIGGEPSRGFATGGEVGDIPPIQNQKYLPPPPTSSRKPRSKASTPQQVVVDESDESDELVEAAYWQAMKANKVILNPSAWRASVRKRIQESGPSAEDHSCLKDWRVFQQAEERRQKAEAEKAAKAAQPVADREFARERASTLSRSFGRSASRRKNPDNGESTANQPQDDGGMPS